MVVKHIGGWENCRSRNICDKRELLDPWCVYTSYGQALFTRAVKEQIALRQRSSRATIPCLQLQYVDTNSQHYDLTEQKLTRVKNRWKKIHRIQ